MITSAWIADAAGAEETSKEKEAKMTVARCSCNAYRWCGTGEAKKCQNDCERLFAICIMRDRQVLCDAIVNCAGRNLNIYDLQWHWKKESHYQCVKPDIRQLPSNYWTRFLSHSSFIYLNLCYSRKKYETLAKNKQNKNWQNDWWVRLWFVLKNEKSRGQNANCNHTKWPTALLVRAGLAPSMANTSNSSWPQFILYVLWLTFWK